MVSIAVITYIHRNEEYLVNCIKGLLDQKIDFQWYILCYSQPKEDFKGLKPIIHLLDDNFNNKSQAYNFILPQLKEAYIAYNDADDISLASRFDKQISYLESNANIDILGGGLIINEEKLGWSVFQNHIDIIKFMIINNPMVNSTIMVRNKPNFWGTEVKYNEAFVRAEDYDFWLQCAKHGLVFANLKEPLISYRLFPKDNSLETLTARIIREDACHFFIRNDVKGEFILDLHSYAENVKMSFWKRFLIKRKIKLLQSVGLYLLSNKTKE